MMSPLASGKPIAIAIGNHEQDDDANGIVAISTQYRFGYTGMPTGGRKDGAMYFSYEVGPAHVISLASFYPGGFGAASPLTQWLVADLAAIDRSKTPWVLVSLHAPWYNSNTAHQGDGEDMRAALEAMLVKAGVAAIFTGHVHAYERTYPVVNSQVVAAGAGPVHCAWPLLSPLPAPRPPPRLTPPPTTPTPQSILVMRARGCTLGGRPRPLGAHSTAPPLGMARFRSLTPPMPCGRGTATRIQRPPSLTRCGW